MKIKLKNLLKEDNSQLANTLYRLHLRLKDAINKHNSKEAERVSKLFTAVEKKLEKNGFDVEKFMLSKGVEKHYNDDRL